MAEDNKEIEDGENEEQEGEQEKKEISQKSVDRRKKLKKLINKIEIAITIVLIIAAFIIVPLKIYNMNENKIKQSFQTNQWQDVFTIPEPEKKDPLATFKFPALRESEDKEFKIKLNDLKAIVTMSMYLGYNKENTDLGEELAQRKLQLIDRIQLIIASKSYEDINTIDKRNINLKKELINEINSILDEGKIENLYITHFFISKLLTN